MRIDKSMMKLRAEEQQEGGLNLAVPSPIFSETEPIAADDDERQAANSSEREREREREV